MLGLGVAAVRVWRTVAGGLMLAVTLITLAQVFARYVLNDSIVWSEELNRLLYVWLILIGAVGADHMRIGLLADQPRLVRPLGVLAACAAIVALGLLAWGGWRLQTVFAFDRYTTLDLSKTWYFSAAVVAAVLWAGTDLWRALRPQRHTAPDSQTSDRQTPGADGEGGPT